MRLSIPFATGLLALAAIAVISIRDIERAIPGPLIASHAQLPELHGPDGCVRCHGTGPASMAASCLTCHAAVDEQIQLGVALHGGLLATQQRDCGSCHAEHLDASSKDWVAFGFHMADLEGPEDFRHQTVDFGLDGRHDSLACSDCHEQADADVLRPEQPRFLGQVQDCTSCHEDPHKGQMQRDCTGCHGQEHDFEDLRGFPHAKEIPLHGSHAGLDCRDCHAKGQPYSVEALSDPKATAPWRTCAQCHEDPHSESFVKGQDLPEVPWPTGQDDCVLCHSEQHATFTDEAMEWRDAWHLPTGFPLEAPHDDLDCRECHGDRVGNEDFRSRYPGRLEKDCSACHEDPHAGQFRRSPHLEEDCRSCHRSDTFAEHGIDLQRHGELGFALKGAHRDTACDACHEPADPDLPHSWQFLGIGSQCADCHADVHVPPFQVEDTLELPSLASGGDCAACHQESDFRRLTGEFDHELWTGFALERGHQGLECSACHAAYADPVAQGRSLGIVAELHPGDPHSCQGCHADVHQGVFDQPQRPPSLAGETGCARCHGTADFRGLKEDSFSHDGWTDFPLTGAHLQADCASCHARDATEHPLGKVSELFPGDWRKCATCHTDPHQGAFDAPHLKTRILDRTGCARCHDSTSFRNPIPGAFDHGYWTGFELQGAHREADCTACHAEQKPGPDNLRLGPTRGSSCTDCHEDPHAGQFLLDAGKDCLSCHDPYIGGFGIPRFDHDRLTRFALDETHAALDCSSCHGEETIEGGAQVIRYRPLGTQCMDCHAVVPDPRGRR